MPARIRRKPGLAQSSLQTDHPSVCQYRQRHLDIRVSQDQIAKGRCRTAPFILYRQATEVLGKRFGAGCLAATLRAMDDDHGVATPSREKKIPTRASEATGRGNRTGVETTPGGGRKRVALPKGRLSFRTGSRGLLGLWSSGWRDDHERTHCTRWRAIHSAHHAEARAMGIGEIMRRPALPGYAHSLPQQAPWRIQDSQE